MSIRSVPRLMAAAVLLAAGFVTAGSFPAAAAARSCPSGGVTTYVPRAGTDMPFGIVVRRHVVWFAHGGTVDRLRHGRITELSIPGEPDASAGWLTLATDGTIWFAERGAGRLGTIDSRDRIAQYPIPDGVNGASAPQAIVVVHDTVWFTDQANNRIGRFDRNTGHYAFYAVPSGDPLGMERGHDGQLYFTERAFDKVARLDPATGLFTEWSLTPGAFPNRLAADRAGNMWFTELRTSSLGRIDSHGRLHQTPLPGGPVGIRYAHHRLYTALNTTGQLGESTTTGRLLRSWTLPGPLGVLQLAVDGPVVWVADGFGDHIYRVDTRCAP